MVSGLSITRYRPTYCTCGEQMYYHSKRCIKCEQAYRKEHSKSDRKPSLDDLRDYLLSVHGNFLEASRKYGVSDNAVRKWCKSYGLPYHSSEYK